MAKKYILNFLIVYVSLAIVLLAGFRYFDSRTDECYMQYQAAPLSAFLLKATWIQSPQSVSDTGWNEPICIQNLLFILLLLHFGIYFFRHSLSYSLKDKLYTSKFDRQYSPGKGIIDIIILRNPKTCFFFLFGCN